jgi:DNA polymerase V
MTHLRLFFPAVRLGDPEPLPVLPETASFPSPAQDYHEPLSLDRHLVRNRAATFVIRVEGSALAPLGILDGDELIVDRSLRPRPGRLIMVLADGPEGPEHRLGIFQVLDGQAFLVSKIGRIRLTDEVRPWGVATIAIKHLLDLDLGTNLGSGNAP